MKKIIMVALLAFVMSGCTKVESGHVGVAVGWNGVYETQELQPGFHQSLTRSVHQIVANEMTVELSNLQPQTKDKTLLKDLDMSFTYTVNPASIVELMTQFKGRNMTTADGDTYPLGQYVGNIVTTSTVDVVSRYDALTVNDNREAIRAAIIAQTISVLKQEKLDEIVHVKQIFIKNMQIADALTNSAIAAIAAQNELKAKTTQVAVAEMEAKRAAMLSQPKNLEYMRVQSQLNISEGVRDGKVSTIIIPSNLTMLGLK